MLPEINAPETELEEESGSTRTYAPIPAGTDLDMVRYLTRHRDRTVALLGQIDETLEVLRRTLDGSQPKYTGKIGLLWTHRPDRFNNGIYPAVVRWSCHRKSGTFDLHWKYKILNLRNLPRMAKSSKNFAAGHAKTVEALKMVQKLMSQRSTLLTTWTNLSRTLTPMETSTADLETLRAPEGAFASLAALPAIAPLQSRLLATKKPQCRSSGGGVGSKGYAFNVCCFFWSAGRKIPRSKQNHQQIGFLNTRALQHSPCQVRSVLIAFTGQQIDQCPGYSKPTTRNN